MYITLFKNNTNHISYTQLQQNNFENYTTKAYKYTYFIENPRPTNTEKITKTQQQLDIIYALLYPYKETYEHQYYTFKIPKRSGGLRTINAPNPDFKDLLRRTKDIFEQNIKVLAHPAAFAYTAQRSIKDALIVHQQNNSNWFLKIDLKNFFNNCTPEIVYDNIKELYPFWYFDDAHKARLKEIIKICSLNNGLPQGTPISPLLTNLLMVSYDYKISQYLYNLNRTSNNKFVYTRYADDILISARKTFSWKTIENELKNILQPFKINSAKTRYGSKAGTNWNLGLMLNKDNNITLGHQKKKVLNAMLNNFLRDFGTPKQWNQSDTYALQGQLSWLKQIEPDYYSYLIQKYEAKYQHTTYAEAIKTIL